MFVCRNAVFIKPRFVYFAFGHLMVLSTITFLLGSILVLLFSIATGGSGLFKRRLRGVYLSLVCSSGIADDTFIKEPC